MSRASQWVVGLIGAVAVVSFVVALTASLALSSTRSDLDKARADLASLSNPNGAPGDLADLRQRVDEADSRLLQVEKSTGALTLTEACKSSYVDSYYEKLLGANQAGTDESGAIGFINAICPRTRFLN